jgi:hypothetical protein
MSSGSNRKNLAKQIGQPIPTNAPMALHAATVATTNKGHCFTCKWPIVTGQRVRWCEVIGYIPAGWIHATHFDDGRLFSADGAIHRMRWLRHKSGDCRHRWSPWRRAGIFDPTEVSKCERCGATRAPKARATEGPTGVRSGILQSVPEQLGHATPEQAVRIYGINEGPPTPSRDEG